jgi:hypothetical protein
MKLFNKKLKPSLVDKNIVSEYMKQKYPDPVKIIHLPAKDPSELQKLLTKIMYNILHFIYHYFFIIAMLLIIFIYLYRRYRWYQKIKIVSDEKRKESKEIKKYFDDIFSGKKDIEDSDKKTNITNYMMTKVPDTLTSPLTSKKMDISISNNNGYLNHLKQSISNNAYNSTMSKKNSSDIIQRIEQPKFNNTSIMSKNSKYNDNNHTNHNNERNISKSVRFANQDFDAYGRNNINPKTGEIIAFNDNETTYCPF